MDPHDNYHDIITGMIATIIKIMIMMITMTVLIIMSMIILPTTTLMTMI